MQDPVVEKHASTNDPAVQSAKIKAGTGSYSHDDELPLRIKVKREGWLGRKISVTTTEPVWYRDAITYIEVPAGFTYDLASIPRTVWWLVSPWDVAMESLFHDLLYRQQEIKRRQADQTMLSMMQDRGVPLPVRWIVYMGVRCGGWIAWKRRAAENKAALLAACEDEETADYPSAIAPDKVEEKLIPDPRGKKP